MCIQFSYRRAYWLRRLYVAARARLSRLPVVWRWRRRSLRAWTYNYRG